MEEAQQYQIFDNLDSYYCQNKHQIIKLCVNRNCIANSLMCNDKLCQCVQPHKNCQHIQFQSLVKRIKRKKIAMNQESKQIAKAIEQIYDEVIDNLSRQRANFMEEIQMFGIGRKTLEFIQKLNRNQEQTNITGQLINDVRFQSQTIQNQLVWAKLHSNDLYAGWRDLQNKLIQQIKSLYRISTQSETEFLKMLSLADQSALCQDKKVLSSKSNKYTYKQWIENTLDSKHQNLQLSLPYCFFQIIPSWITIFQKIQFLNLSNNSISKIDRLETLHNLKVLNLSRNIVNKIQNLSTLKNLENLKLCYNKITVIENLDDNPKLNCLYISKNKGLVNLAHLGKVTGLKTIFINQEDLANPQQLQLLNNLAKTKKIKIQKYLSGVIYNPYRQKIESKKKAIAKLQLRV